MLALLTAEVPTDLAELEQELLRVRGEIEIRELYFSRLAAARAAYEGNVHDGGDQTNIDWIRHTCRMTQQAAADRVRVGEQLEAMPRSEYAFYNGHIGFQHLAVMARTAAVVGEAFDESKLLPLAMKYSPGKFHHVSIRYRHTVHPKRVAEEQANMAEYNSLKLSTAEDGCLFVNGVFDPVTGATIRSSLEALAKPMGSTPTATATSGWPTPLPKSRPATCRFTCKSQARSKRSSACWARQEQRASSPSQSRRRRSSVGHATQR